MKNILIAGCGRLGARYLEGIIKINDSLNIHIFDTSRKSIDRAENLIMNSKNLYNHKFYFHYKKIKKNLKFKILIIASTADTRIKILKYLNSKISYKFCILEKVLSQKKLGKINELGFKNINNVWVNTPRKIMPLYKKIRDIVDINEPLELSVEGVKWGVSCNGCHYIDLLHWMRKETIIEIKDLNYDKKTKWYETKRSGFYDFTGTIEIKFSKGSKIIFNSLKKSKNNKKEHKIIIKSGKKYIEINEFTGKVKCNNKYLFREKLLLQSYMSINIIKNLFKNEHCKLTSLSDHFHNHNIFLSFLIKKFNKDNNSFKKIIPIT